MATSPEPCARKFQFERDTLSFANELVWQYHFNPATGSMRVSRNHPSPTYSHRCFVLVRSVRQFLYHAAFEPDRPKLEDEIYRHLIRQVVRSNPRARSEPQRRVVFAGYDGLRAFSLAHQGLLQAELGGAWQSYFLRSHWRMVFPVWRLHQERMAEQLSRAMSRGAAPAVHLFTFPRITINHGILLFDMEQSSEEIAFAGYDPNITAHPVTLFYERARRAFRFPPTTYWPGGDLKVIEIYRGGLY